MAPAPRENIQDFTVSLELADHKRLKMQAAEERRPMVAILRDAIRSYLDLYQPLPSKSPK